MAQGTLVAALIEDGWELINQLLRSDFPIAAAWWVKPIEEPGANREWQLFLASPMVDQLGSGVTYRKAYDALRSMPNFDPVLARISLGMIKMIDVSNPMTKEAVKILERFRGRPPISVGRCRLGEIEAEEVFVYPLSRPAPWQQVVLKSPVDVVEPPSPQDSQTMSQMVASGIELYRAGIGAKALTVLR